MGTEELIFVNERSVFRVVFSDHGRNCVSKSLSVNEPQI